MKITLYDNRRLEIEIECNAYDFRDAKIISKLFPGAQLKGNSEVCKTYDYGEAGIEFDYSPMIQAATVNVLQFDYLTNDQKLKLIKGLDSYGVFNIYSAKTTLKESALLP